MNRNVYILPVVCLAVLLVLSGCSNPADDVPEADVTSAEPVFAPQMGDAAAGGVAYAFTSESKITWVGSKVTGSHDGGFTTFSGGFINREDVPENTTGSIEIDIHSMWSDNDRLTGHLKSADFFDVETFPTSTFTLAKVQKTAEGYTVSGELLLHGVTKSISFPAKIAKNGDEITLSAEFFIKRFDFGIVYPGRADDLIRDEVVIKLDMKAVPSQS
jgi:polyisoprenoid-binding protein YceI